MAKKKKIVLTKREKQILILICREKRAGKIATALKISIRTVETHKKNIYQKTKAKSVIGLFKYALRNKLVLMN